MDWLHDINKLKEVGSYAADSVIVAALQLSGASSTEEGKIMQALLILLAFGRIILSILQLVDRINERLHQKSQKNEIENE